MIIMPASACRSLGGYKSNLHVPRYALLNNYLTAKSGTRGWGQKFPTMALQSSAFSTDGSETISRQIRSFSRASVEKNIREYYEIDRCLRFIASHESFKKVSRPLNCITIVRSRDLQVALQFPDQLLCDSVAVTTTLAQESGRECVILGDTSYGR